MTTVLGAKVWVPDPQHGFFLGRIVDDTVDLRIAPIGTGAAQPAVRVEDVRLGDGLNCLQVSANYDDLHPAEEEDGKEVDDCCSLMHLNEATLLHNTRLRYSTNRIYVRLGPDDPESGSHPVKTYVANILISINPYEQIADLYCSETVRNYRGKSLGALPPHVFAIGRLRILS
jgi:myosin-6